MTTESAILLFYKSRGPDQSGRTLEEILQWDNEALERVHDFIQWLFPLNEASGANWRAPILTAADIDAFRTDVELRRALRRSFVRMLSFYGLALHDEGPLKIDRAENWAARSNVWVTPNNHNHLRLTRIMKSLALLGLPELASALREVLLKEAARAPRGVISAATLQYWSTTAF